MALLPSSPVEGIPQSTFIGGALLAGFVLFLAAKGRLTTYSAALWGSSTTSASASATASTLPITISGSSSGGSSSAVSSLSTAATVAAIAA